MIDTAELYPSAFFRGRSRYNWRAPIVCSSIVQACVAVLDLGPRSAVDVGCAIGDLTAQFNLMGIEAVGLEGSPCAKEHIVCDPEAWHCVDMREPIAGPWYDYDVCTCFEVAEHLEEECADTFVDNLCLLSNVLIMSACPPHATKKPTKFHVNEQEGPYWDEKFKARNYARHLALEEALKVAWHPWRKKYGIAAFYQNLLVYTQEGGGE